jgi:hypothetical protein
LFEIKVLEDSKQLGFAIRTRLELVKIAPGGKQRLLHQVFSLSFVPVQMQGVTQQTRSVRENHTLEFEPAVSWHGQLVRRKKPESTQPH